MIKINFLGDESTVDTSGRLLLLGYAASILACLLIFFFMQTSIGSHINSLKEEVASLETRLGQLKKTTEEVRQLESKKKRIDQITATIARLKLSQEGPVRVMDDLNRAIPGKAWLRKVEENNGEMKLIGLALNDSQVVEFLRNLEASNFFDNINLVENVSVSLLKITALNHFTSKYTYYTVRVEERNEQFRRISNEAKKAGLKFTKLDGPPSYGGRGGTVRVMNTSSAKGPARVESGVFRRRDLRVEKVSAWSSVEPVRAKAFIVTAKVLYSGKLKKILEEQRARLEKEQGAPDEKARQDGGVS